MIDSKIVIFNGLNKFFMNRLKEHFRTTQRTSALFISMTHVFVTFGCNLSDSFICSMRTIVPILSWARFQSQFNTNSQSVSQSVKHTHYQNEISIDCFISSSQHTCALWRYRHSWNRIKDFTSFSLKHRTLFIKEKRSL